MSDGAPLLAINDLHVEFAAEDGAVRAVRGFDLAIASGEIVGLVGESGCGKSVTALAVMGLLPETASIARGAIRFEGIELGALPARARADLRGARMAMVFQEPMSSLNPVMTIGRQIGETLERHRGMTRRDARRRAVELLDRVRMPDAARRVDDHPHLLSGGMRQRAMLAMALACDPALLIADEPTTALDVTVQAQILDLLRDLQRELGLAVLLITHDLGVVAETASRVVVMYAGRACEEADAASLFARPRHPYTAGLMRALPPGRRRRGERSARLEDIPGSVPRLDRPIPGCGFAPRCARALPRCADDTPSLTRHGEHHRAACFNAVP
jgi:peptide/nickel transport system ATP-binding protein